MNLSFFEKMTAADKNKYFYLGLLAVFIILAAVISSEFSRDSIAYNYMFNKHGATGLVGLSSELFNREPFLLVVGKIIYKLGLSAFFLFLIHAVISLPCKFYLIDKYSKDRFLSLAFFFSYFFILHDCTQIRFGMAVAFVYLGLHFLADNRRLVFSVIVVLTAALIHNAALVFVIMLFFTTKKSLIWLLGMVAVAVLLYSANFNIVISNLIGGLVDYFGVEGTRLNKLHAYMSKPSSDIFLGMFRPIPLLVYFCTIIIFRYRVKFNAYETLCYKALLLSVFFYILLKDIPDLQVRFADMFGFSLVFLVPYVHRGLSEYIGTKYAYIILYSFFAIHLIKYTLYDKMLVL